MNCQQKLAFAKDLALKTGKMAISLRNKTPVDAFVSEKHPQDFLTLADTTVQQVWCDAICATYDTDYILGEEKIAVKPAHIHKILTDGGDYDIHSNTRGLWVIDPIDGTANFMHQLPEWGISVAYIQGGKIQFSVIYLPDIKRLLWAVNGGGAFVQNSTQHKISVSLETVAHRATLVFSRSYRWHIDRHLESIKALEKHYISYRLFGSACYAFACVAEGRVEGFFEPHMHPWDMVAGMLMVAEAGGKVTAPSLAKVLCEGGDVLSTNGRILFPI